MDRILILINFLSNLVAGTLIFFLGLFWPLIPKSYHKFFLRRFWGKGTFTDDLIISYGTLIDSRLLLPNPPLFRFIKRYHNGQVINIAGPSGNIVGDCEIRSASYIISALGKYRKKAVPVVDDQTGFRYLNKTYIALGSPSSNEISSLALGEPNNVFLEFVQQGNTVSIRDKQGGTMFPLQPTNRDYGLIVKIRNVRFPGHFFFVCAGLGEWGTSGSAWYLGSKWRELHSQFGQEFGIVVEVAIGCDESAAKIFP